MKAMLFAAGLGTRLRPITDSIPKPLIKIGGITLLEYAVRKLQKYGFSEIVVNVHHLADQIEEFLHKHNNFGANISVSDERELLLETGGGIKKAAYLLRGSDPFLIFNSDIVTDLDLKLLYDFHTRADALVTLAVRQRPSGRCFLFDDQQRLCGWRNLKTGAEKIAVKNSKLIPLAFSGIHIVSPYALDLLPENRVFSLVDFYLNIAADNKIIGYDHSGGYWTDVGKPETLDQIAGLDLRSMM